MLVAACGSQQSSPRVSASVSASVAPSASPTSEVTATPDATIPPPTSSPTPAAESPGTVGGPTSTCFGSSDTKGFFGSFAQSVSWPVYCAVLPSGWSVVQGTYRLKDGGRLTISYRRRADDARVVLDEGALCLDGTGCVPSGSDAGTIPFGDRQADLVATGSDYAAVVDRGENPSWLLTSSGLSEADFAAIAADLHLIDE